MTNPEPREGTDSSRIDAMLDADGNAVDNPQDAEVIEVTEVDERGNETHISFLRS